MRILGQILFIFLCIICTASAYPWINSNGFNNQVQAASSCYGYGYNIPGQLSVRGYSAETINLSNTIVSPQRLRMWFSLTYRDGRNPQGRAGLVLSGHSVGRDRIFISLSFKDLEVIDTMPLTFGAEAKGTIFAMRTRNRLSGEEATITFDRNLDKATVEIPSAGLSVKDIDIRIFFIRNCMTFHP